MTARFDHVVVVGAGLGGLSAALRLAGAGRRVTVVERSSLPGGRAGRLDLDGYRFDTGPTVLTMPSLIADALACVDEDIDDWLDLKPLDPAYRAFFPDGSQLDVVPDVDRMAVSVGELCGVRDAEGYRRFAAYAEQLYRVERDAFIDRNHDSPFGLLTTDLARLVALGGFGRLGPTVGRFVRDPRLRRVLSFQALYAGVTPSQALALYASITYLDSVAGVFAPVGGMHAVPTALAAAATKHGVDVRYDTEVTAVEMRDGRAVGVRTRNGERLAADAVVVNADLPAAWDLIERGGGRAPRRRALRWSPSCVLFLAGLRAQWRGIAHHNLHFGPSWREPMRELRTGQLMTDPSLLVSAPTVTDPSLAPAGSTAAGVVVLVPNLTTRLDWKALAPRFRDELVVRLERFGYVGFGDAIDVSHVTTPADWAAQGLAAGTPFSAAHLFRQTGPFRPRNRIADNVVLAGCGTHPGIGIPMVLLSGRLAAERLLGPVR